MNSSKKIGITTFWDTPANYGQVLQAFALTQILKEMGYSPFILRYTMGEEVYTESLFDKLIGLLTNKDRFISFFKRFYLKSEKNVNRGFDNFKNKYLKYSEKTYSSFNELTGNYPNASIYITGSDQVWGEWGSFNKKNVFLLNFLSPKVKRLAYAASFGRSEISEVSEKELFRNSFKKFDFVSVREKSGLHICETLGMHAEYVVDPTLLLSKESWIKELDLKYSLVKTKQAFVYLMSDNYTCQLGHKLISYLTELGYHVRYVSSAYYQDKKANFRPSIEEWLEAILESDVVVTSSFHGTIFATNFNKPVISLVRAGGNVGQNTRMYSILEDFGLSHRILDTFDKKEIDNLLMENIDWNKVNSLLYERRIKSLDFLKNALEHDFNYSPNI